MCIRDRTRTARTWTREGALVELLRGRLSVVGPTTASDLAASLALQEAELDAALLARDADRSVPARTRGGVAGPITSPIARRTNLHGLSCCITRRSSPPAYARSLIRQ